MVIKRPSFQIDRNNLSIIHHSLYDSFWSRVLKWRFYFDGHDKDNQQNQRLFPSLNCSNTMAKLTNHIKLVTMYSKCVSPKWMYHVLRNAERIEKGKKKDWALWLYNSLPTKLDYY